MSSRDKVLLACPIVAALFGGAYPSRDVLGKDTQAAQEELLSLAATAWDESAPLCGLESLLPPELHFHPKSSIYDYSKDQPEARFRWTSEPAVSGRWSREKGMGYPILSLDNKNVQAGKAITIRIFQRSNSQELLKLTFKNTFTFCDMKPEHWEKGELTIDLAFNFPVHRDALGKHLQFHVANAAKPFEWQGAERSTTPRLKLKVTAEEMKRPFRMTLAPTLTADGSRAGLNRMVSVSKDLKPLLERSSLIVPIPNRYWDKKLFKPQQCNIDRGAPDIDDPHICFYGPYRSHGNERSSAEGGIVDIILRRMLKILL